MKFFSTLVASVLGTLVALAIVFLFFLFFVFALAASSDQAPRVRDGSVLVADLSGGLPEIVSGDPLAQVFANEPALDLRSVTAALDKAAGDRRIAGLWLRIGNSSIPLATLDEVRGAVGRFRDSGKPVFASSEDYVTTEIEYYLMSVADSVFASPEGIFEYNGFAIVVSFFKGLMDKLEIEPQIVRAGRFKSAVEPFQRSDFSEENELQLQELLDGYSSRYVAAVADARGMSVEELRARASEDAIFSTREAVDAGLVDELAFADQIAEMWKDRLGVEEDDDLRTVELAAYSRVSPSSAGQRSGNEGEIAIVYAVGEIVSGASDGQSPLGGTTVGSKTFSAAIEQARESERVKAIVLRVSSPGGFAPAADAMLREVALAREEKPVVVSMGDLAASGGYWISMEADTILANPYTLTGSIGAFSMLFNLGNFFSQKLGITFDAVRTSPHADMLSGVRPLTSAEIELLQRSVDTTYAAFLKKVSENRGLGVEQVRELAEGRVWSGDQALDLGLVDLVGDLDRAVEVAAELAGLEEGTYRVRVLPRPRTFLERLTRSMQTKAVETYTRLALSPAERAIAEQMRAVSQAVRYHGRVQARLPFDVVIGG